MRRWLSKEQQQCQIEGFNRKHRRIHTVVTQAYLYETPRVSVLPVTVLKRCPCTPSVPQCITTQAHTITGTRLRDANERQETQKILHAISVHTAQHGCHLVTIYVDGDLSVRTGHRNSPYISNTHYSGHCVRHGNQTAYQ